MDARITTARRATQLSSLVALLGLALSGQVRVDFEVGSVVVFGNHIWPHEIGLILLVAAAPLVVLAGFSLFLGRAFCGWLCPQTLLCEAATWLQRRVATFRRRGRFAYVLAATAALALAGTAALGGAAIILNPFLPAHSLRELAGGTLNTSLLKGVTVISLLLLVDVGFFRHSFCEWICVVGWWQRLFAGPTALRVRFDIGRARECTRCTECKAACFMGIEPRRRSLPGTCLNCGECVKACDRQMAFAGSASLIRYATGGELAGRQMRTRPANVARFGGYGLLLAVFAGLFVWSAWSRSPVQIKVRQAGQHAVTVVGDQAEGTFVVDVYNASDSHGLVRLRQTGLPPESVAITPNPVPVPPMGKAEASLRFALDRGALRPGRNSFSVTADDGQDALPDPGQRVTFGLPAYLP